MHHIKSTLAIVTVFQFCSSTAALSETCSLNLMWLNKDKNNTPYILPEDLPKLPGKKTVDRIKEWHDMNPACTLNLWYNHQTVEDSQIENTKKLLADHGLNDAVNMRDIWTIKTVKDNAAVFQDPVPIYYRVDLLRAVVADELAEDAAKDPQAPRYIIYADLNIPPMENAKLFDAWTMPRLNKIGFLLSKPANKTSNYENGFFMMDGHNGVMRNTHREVIIQYGLDKAKDFLAKYNDPNINPQVKKEMPDEIMQYIYFRYPRLMMEYTARIPDLKGRNFPMEQFTKDVGQPVSHLSTFSLEGAL